VQEHELGRLMGEAMVAGIIAGLRRMGWVVQRRKPTIMTKKIRRYAQHLTMKTGTNSA
jgi:hypothetical protein